MALGDVNIKKLFQGPLSAAVTVVYTAPAGVCTQITEIWVDNQNTSNARKLDIYAHGTALINRLNHNVPLPADIGTILSDCKIVLAPNEVLALKQDTGTDVVVTIYGIEEVVA